MSLVYWVPMTSNFTQQGISDATISNNGVTIVSGGKLGNCGYFDGNGHYLEFSKTVGDLYSGDFSYAVWLKPTDSTRSIIFSEYASTGSSNIAFELNAARNIRLYWNGSPDIYPSNCTLPINEWTHVVIARSGDTIKFYMNGNLAHTYTGTLTDRTSTSKIRLGDDYRGGTSVSYQGYMNDARLYSHCLSPREVSELSKALLLHYPMTGGGRGQANLYTGTADFSGTWDGASNWTTDTTQTYKGFVVKKRNGAWGGLAQKIPATNGDIFTISFYAKVDSGGNVQSVHRSNLGNVTTGLNILGGNFSNGGTVWIIDDEAGDKWKYCWATVQIVSTDITWLQWRIENSNSTTTMYICGFKMERGDKPTPWMPNSSDSAYTTMGYNNNTEYDTSGYLHNGTISGSVEYSSDTARYSVSTEFVKAGYINVPSFNVDTSAFTLNFWVKMKTATSQHFVLGTFTSWTNNGIGVYRDANAEWYSCLIRSAGESTYKAFSLYPTVGSWHMLTLTYDGTHYKGYLNGVLKQNATYGSGGVVSNPVFMVGNSKFNGTPSSENEEAFVSDVRFYATCLDQEDITKLYNTSASIANNGVLMSYEFAET